MIHSFRKQGASPPAPSTGATNTPKNGPGLSSHRAALRQTHPLAPSSCAPRSPRRPGTDSSSLSEGTCGTNKERGWPKGRRTPGAARRRSGGRRAAGKERGTRGEAGERGEEGPGPRGGDSAPPPSGGGLWGPRASRAHEGRGSAPPPRPRRAPPAAARLPGRFPARVPTWARRDLRSATGSRAGARSLGRRWLRLPGPSLPRPRGAGVAEPERAGRGRRRGRSAGSLGVPPRPASPLRTRARLSGLLCPRRGVRPPNPEEPPPVSFYPAHGQPSLLPPAARTSPTPASRGLDACFPYYSISQTFMECSPSTRHRAGGWGFKDNQDRQSGFEKLPCRTGTSQRRGQEAVTMQRAGKDLSVHCALGARRREGGEVGLGRLRGSVLPGSRGVGLRSRGEGRGGGRQLVCRGFWATGSVKWP